MVQFLIYISKKKYILPEKGGHAMLTSYMQKGTEMLDELYAERNMLDELYAEKNIDNLGACGVVSVCFHEGSFAISQHFHIFSFFFILAKSHGKRSFICENFCIW